MIIGKGLRNRRLDQVHEPIRPPGAPPPEASFLSGWRLLDLLTPPFAVLLGLAAAIVAYGFWLRF